MSQVMNSEVDEPVLLCFLFGVCIALDSGTVWYPDMFDNGWSDGMGLDG